MTYIGIDPGVSGGLAVVRHYPDADAAGLEIGGPEAFAFSQKTPHDMAYWLNCETARGDTFAVLEKVASSPQMGVKSAFTFGANHGFWVGLLTGLHIPYALVSPQKWQKAMGCLTKGDKNISKAAAQRLYPNEKITHSVADALLLATYCRRHHAELF